MKCGILCLLRKTNFSLGSLLGTLLLCRRLLLLGFLSRKEVERMGNGVARAGGAGQELVTNGYTQVLGNANIPEWTAAFNLLSACFSPTLLMNNISSYPFLLIKTIETSLFSKTGSMKTKTLSSQLLTVGLEQRA